MGTRIQISDETKEQLSRLKRDDETWDDLLRRLMRENTARHVGSWSDEEATEVRETVKQSP